MKKKLAIFCLPGMDNFLDWVPFLESDYEIKMVVTSDHKTVYRAMEWADILFCEWANEMAAVVTRHMINTPDAENKRVVIRLHSYEALDEYPNQIIWEDVDQLIFVATHIMIILYERFQFFHSLVKGYEYKTAIINNGVDLDKIEWRKPPGHGLNIAVVGSITHKKNPTMVLQILEKLNRITGRDYKVHWAGGFQEPRYEIYLKYMVKELKLEDNVIFYGKLSSEVMDEFWEDKNYLLHTSVHEGHCYSIIEAMARNIMPVIHNSRGADIYMKKTFNTVDEALQIIIDMPEAYCQYGRETLREKGWTLKNQVTQFRKVLGYL